MDIAELEALLQRGETQTVEYKASPPRLAELAVRLCGLANASGGVIVLGVADESWEVVGLKRPQEAIDALLQAARLCKPPVSFTPPQPQELVYQEKYLIVAVVPPSDGPIYQAGGTFYMRRGTHTVPLELSELAHLLYQRGLLAWETQPAQRATLADLDMRLVEQYIAQRSPRSQHAGRLANHQEVLLNLGCALAVEEQEQSVIRPTNAGLLLFGRKPQDLLLQTEVVCILYRDPLGLHRYADRRILRGTIAQQIDQAEAFFLQHVPVAARIEGFHRLDEPDYPLEALREAVVNAVVHRDYSLQSEAVRIFYYPDRIEIRNPGVLLPGLRLEDLQRGQARSKPRNPVLAMVLRDLPGGYMERAGTGIRFMLQQSSELGLPSPQFREQGEFIVTFLKREMSSPQAALIDTGHTSAPSSRSQESEKMPAEALALSDQERQALGLRYVHEHGSITNQQYRELTGVSDRTALRDLEALVMRGALRTLGKRRGRRYIL
ncbi:MAG TPA: helix-turn-helix domain-containing protein [Ktedonobacterales bacterium]|nr:helix-turn-helix domain-containing protein [Ktedonobacterales bacterium]